MYSRSFNTAREQNYWRPLYHLKLAARQGLDGLGDYAASMASFLFYLPTALLWLATILLGAAVGWRILRRAGRALFLPRARAAQLSSTFRGRRLWWQD